MQFRLALFSFTLSDLERSIQVTHHITYVKGKLSRGIGIICKARKVLKKETLIKLYISFSYPFLAYCIEV